MSDASHRACIQKHTPKMLCGTKCLKYKKTHVFASASPNQRMFTSERVKLHLLGSLESAAARSSSSNRNRVTALFGIVT